MADAIEISTRSLSTFLPAATIPPHCNLPARLKSMPLPPIPLMPAELQNQLWEEVAAMKSPDLIEAYLEHLVAEDVIAADAASAVLEAQQNRTTPIGRLAILKGYLDMKQVFKVLNTQIDTDLRFGEQAIELGYLDEDQLSDLLAEQRQSQPGIGHVVHDLGFATKGVLQKKRRSFMRELESALA